MYIRWLGAFGKNGTLKDSLEFEISRPIEDEVAAEKIQNGVSYIKHARVGLLIKNKAVFKEFNGDCWSVLRDGKLVKTRNPRYASSSHIEVWAHPVYIGIVIKNEITKEVFKFLKDFSKNSGVPLYKMKKGGGLKEIKESRVF